jgi:hypothetical protein
MTSGKDQFMLSRRSGGSVESRLRFVAGLVVGPARHYQRIDLEPPLFSAAVIRVPSQIRYTIKDTNESPAEQLEPRRKSAKQAEGEKHSKEAQDGEAEDPFADRPKGGTEKLHMR